MMSVARLEATSATSTALRSRIKETINRILTGDTTLAQRIQTLFLEQGVTIFSILTALGLAISTLVLALTGGSSGGSGAAASTPKPSPEPSPETSPSPEPSNKGGVKEWIKTKLASLGRMLAWLGEKALSALPGLIGTSVSWLVKAASTAVGWLAQNMWALILALGGLVYTAALAYINRRSVTHHHRTDPPIRNPTRIKVVKGCFGSCWFIL